MYICLKSYHLKTHRVFEPKSIDRSKSERKRLSTRSIIQNLLSLYVYLQFSCLASVSLSTLMHLFNTPARIHTYRNTSHTHIHTHDRMMSRLVFYIHMYWFQLYYANPNKYLTLETGLPKVRTSSGIGIGIGINLGL